MEKVVPGRDDIVPEAGQLSGCTFRKCLAITASIVMFLPARVIWAKLSRTWPW